MKPNSKQLAKSVDPIIRAYVDACVAEAMAELMNDLGSKIEAVKISLGDTALEVMRVNAIANAATEKANKPFVRKLGRME